MKVAQAPWLPGVVARPGLSAHEILVAGPLAVALGAVAVRGLAPSKPFTIFLLLAVALPFAAIFVGGLKRLLLAIAVVNISLGWDIHFSYDAAAAARGAIGGLSFSLTTIALAGLFALWAAEVLAKPEAAVRLRLRNAWPGALYVAFTALSLFAAHDVRLSFFELALILQGFLLFLYVASFVRAAGDVRFVVGVLVLSLAGQSSIIIASQHFGLDLRLPGLEARTDIGERTRVAGTLGGPNTAGSFLAAALLLTVSIFLAAARHSRHRLTLLAIALGAVALILTFSRGAWVAFAVGLLVLLALMLRRGMTSGRIVAVAALTAVLALAFGGAVADRFTRDGTATTQARVSLFDTAVDVIRDHPLLGVGANNYVVVMPSYRELTRYAHIPHNKFALVWAEAGIGALLAFVVLILVFLRRASLAVRAADETMFPYAAGVTAAFVALCVHMNFEPFHGRLQTQMIWLLGGLITALWCMLRPATQETR